MRKIISVLLAITLVFMLTSCSRESKFGVGEFCDRIRADYEIEVNESSVYLDKHDGKNRIYCTCNSFLLVLYLGVNDNISGVAMMIQNDQKDKLESFLDSYKKCVCVFTGMNFEDTTKIFSDLKISADKINFADNSSVCTVGKYKYSIITNEMTITLFCERV